MLRRMMEAILNKDAMDDKVRQLSSATYLYLFLYSIWGVSHILYVIHG